MIKILKDLDPEDHFGIIIFDHTVDLWKESLSRATKESISEAVNFVNTIRDRGCEQNK